MGASTKPEGAVPAAPQQSSYPAPSPMPGPPGPAQGVPMGPPPPMPPPPGPVVWQPAPIPGINIRPPRVPPQPGQVIVGYEVYKYEAGCCKCEGMTQGGLIAIIVLLFLFWPLAWVPCVMPECFESYQVPVYGFPQQPMSAQPHMHGPPTGAPVYPVGVAQQHPSPHAMPAYPPQSPQPAQATI